MKYVRRLAYRIERATDGVGPWAGGAWAGVYSQPYPGAMPCPEEDVCLRHKGVPVRKRLGSPWEPESLALAFPKQPFAGGLFAFPSIPVMRRWVGYDAIRSAHRRGFICRVFAVEWDGHVLYSDQIVFDPTRAIKVRELPLPNVDVELEVRALRRLAA